MAILNLILKITLWCCLVSYVSVNATKGVPQKRSPRRSFLTNRLQQTRGREDDVKPIEPRIPRFGNTSSSNEGPVYKRVGGHSNETINSLSSLTTGTNCGTTYILEEGQVVLLYSRHDLYAYECETVFRPANVDTTSITMTCPDFALKFNCYFESLTIERDGSKKTYCRTDGVPDASGKEFIIKYKRNLMGFNGGFICILTAVEVIPPRILMDVEVIQPKSQCGVTAAMEKETNDNHRVVGGQNADKKEHPWMAYLKMTVGRYNYEYRCGGSLITDKHILSAAHCFYGYDIKYIDVALGKHDVTNVLEDGSIWRKTDNYIVHGSYDDDIILNDIAIVILGEPITFSDVIRPICLPASDFNFPTKTVTATGWGALDYGGIEAEVLQEVELSIQPNLACKADWQNKFNDDSFFIFDSQICAKGQEKDTCSGDSGGPLIYLDEDKWVLVGITSFGYRCADPDVAGVYTRVNKYISWIDTKTNNN